MGTAERRMEIMRILLRRRYEKITRLAEEFGVSKRTILRDVEALSVTEPIYTRCGRYGGGVYVTDDYSISRMYMTEKELLLLHKLSEIADKRIGCELSAEENKLLKSIILQYTKPKNIKEI